MLVLSRYRNEGLVFGEDLFLTVVDLLPEAAKLTFRNSNEWAPHTMWVVAGESDQASSGVRVTLLEIKEGESGQLKARIGIEAPPTLPIYRKELWEKFGTWPED